MAEYKQLHVAVFPWLAFGHMLPFLELAKAIAKRGHKVSFLSTPRNVDRLPKIPPSLNSTLNLIKFQLPHIDGLPENAEATTDMSSNKVQYLKKAYDGLQPELAQFLESSSVDWIIYDFAPHWLPSITAKLGISNAFFATVNAWSGTFFGSIATMNGGDYRTKLEDYTIPPKWIPFPSNVALRLNELRRYGNRVEENISGISDQKRFAMAVRGCHVFLIRSCKELENNYLDLLHELHQKPMIPVGLLPPLAQDFDDDMDDTWHTINTWLNMHQKETVLYVALGSEAMPSEDELTELANGLELSGVPFFWALRKHQSLTGSQPFELLDGFEDRVKGRGIVWTSWTPQIKILSHDSVGGFLTHCGWSSVIEGLQNGRPLVMLPFVGDQGLNARVLEEKMVGIEIPRNEEDGSMSCDSVAESIKLIMNHDMGNIYRERTMEIQSIFGGRDLHESYLDSLVQFLQKSRHANEDS